MDLLIDPQAWIAFFTLTALELVLGIDNIIFISILVDRLPPERREVARHIGLGLAMFMRVGLLLLLAWIVGLTAPLFTVLGNDISGRDLILLAGGLFLLWKATGEIHELLEDHGDGHKPASAARARCASGSRPTSIEMKMMLSTPRTISSAVSVKSAIHACGSDSHSMGNLPAFHFTSRTGIELRCATPCATEPRTAPARPRQSAAASNRASIAASAAGMP